MPFAIIALCMSNVRSTQFIAGLGSPSATSGKNAQLWGFWPVDPGPRGVQLNNFKIDLADGVAPAAYKFKLDKKDMIVMIKSKTASKHHVRTVQTWSHAILAGNRIPPEAICGHKQNGNRADWSDSGEVWYCNHPFYTRSALNPLEPPRLSRLPKNDRSSTQQNAAAKASAAEKKLEDIVKSS